MKENEMFTSFFTKKNTPCGVLKCFWYYVYKYG